MPVFALIGDVHGQRDRLVRALDSLTDDPWEALLLTGDLRGGILGGHFGSAEPILRETASRGRPVVFVPGNHDLPDTPEVPGTRNVDGRVIEVAGLRVGGIGGAPWFLPGFAYQWTEDAMEGRPVLDADILLSHTPPRDCGLDRTHMGKHVGSRVVRGLLDTRPYLLCVCGHIHEAPGCERVGRVPTINMGSLGDRTRVGLVTVEAQRIVVQVRDLDAHDTQTCTFMRDC